MIQCGDRDAKYDTIIQGGLDLFKLCFDFLDNTTLASQMNITASFPLTRADGELVMRIALRNFLVDNDSQSHQRCLSTWVHRSTTPHDKIS